MKPEIKLHAPTINHRFIALMLHNGKKSVSYNVFLNALSRCKSLLDISNKSIAKSATKKVDNDKNKNPQKVPIKYSLNNLILRNPAMLSPKTKDFSLDIKTLPSEKNMGFESASTSIGMDRGRSNRFRNNLLDHTYEGEGFSSTFNPKTGVKIKTKVGFLSYNSVNLHNSPNLNLQDGTHLLFPKFRDNRRLLSRRFGSALGEKIDVPDFSFPSKEGSIGIKGAPIKLITTVQGCHEQDLSKNPFFPGRSLLQQKGTDLKKNREIYGIECTKIGIDSANSVSPGVETRKVRIGGATYSVPSVPHTSRQEGLGVRSIVACALNKKKRSKYPLALCLALELVDSLKNEGQSAQKRDQDHQLAATNRAYTRYRWW
jgi:ribosomal protein S7